MNPAAFSGMLSPPRPKREHYLIVARNTEAIPESDFVSLIGQTITVRKMLYGLLTRLPIPERDTIGKVSARRNARSRKPKG
jgi:hypothetical protein